FNVWKCGGNKDTCYNGMVGVKLVDPASPTASRLGDPAHSPLIWINPTTGIMPADSKAPNEEGKNAILAWLGACAQNN
ncbi:MAG TPA: hypothetical protein VFT22_02495, partial [Kofleriaceae bacterium]|nr:hypothetical protein [Kofleriaceae bacterium]